MRSLWIIAFLLLPTLTLAQGQPRPVASQIEAVTVFARGAQVTREAEVLLPAGQTRLVFEDLTPELDPKSIQLDAEGDFTVLSVAHRKNIISPPGRPERVRELRAEKAAKEDSVKIEEMLLHVYAQEEAVMMENKAIRASEPGTQVEALKAAVEFYRTRLTDIKTKQLDSNRTLARLQEDIATLDREISRLTTSRPRKETSEVTVTLTSTAQTSATFALSYLTPSAGWYPRYDVRVEDTEHPIALAYNANVFQSSGEAWNDVSLTLSTGNPALPGSRPALTPWWIGFQQRNAAFTATMGRRESGAFPGPYTANPRHVQGRVETTYGEPIPGANVYFPGTHSGTTTDMDGLFLVQVPPGAKTIAVTFIGFQAIEAPITSEWISFVLAEDHLQLDEIIVESGPAERSRRRERNRADRAVPVQTAVQPTTVEFKIDLPYTIRSDGKPNAVKIEEHEVPATYEYYCAPKLDPDAFLTARITDWEDYYLLNGEVNLFFEGTFVGTSFLDVQSVRDTLVVSLGRDKNVVVHRTRRKDFSTRQLLGKNQTERLAFDIEVRNNRPSPVRIVVEDQVPVSTNERIEVKSDIGDNAELDAETGLVRWRLALPPSASETLALQYSVKYPKGERVALE